MSEKILSNGPGYVLTEEDEKTLHRVPQIDFPNMKSQVDVISNEVRPKLIPLHIANVEFEYGPAIKKGDLGILSVRKVAGTFLEQFELKSFPVDLQKLHIIARPTDDARAIMLRQFPSPFSKSIKPNSILPPFRNHISPFARNVEPGWECTFPLSLSLYTILANTTHKHQQFTISPHSKSSTPRVWLERTLRWNLI